MRQFSQLTKLQNLKINNYTKALAEPMTVDEQRLVAFQIYRDIRVMHRKCLPFYIGNQADMLVKSYFDYVFKMKD